MRYLGLDIGSRYIGIASGEVLAAELTTLVAPKDENFYSEEGKKSAYEQIGKFMRQEQAEAIVAGMPMDEDGNHTEESRKIEGLCKEMERALSVEIFFVDETLTSFMAGDMLESQGADKTEIEERQHQLAAQLILQQFLEDAEENID